MREDRTAASARARLWTVAACALLAGAGGCAGGPFSTAGAPSVADSVAKQSRADSRRADRAPSSAPTDVAAARAAVLRDLEAGRWDHARAGAEALAAARPFDAESHLLVALALHAGGRPEDLELAEAGYAAAARYAGRAYWPQYLAGLAALERDEPRAALRHLAGAVIADPASTDALGALATAAYRAGDLALAGEAARRARLLDPADAGAWRLAALAAAGRGDAAGAEAVIADAPFGLDPAEQARVAARADVLWRTASVDQPQEDGGFGGGGHVPLDQGFGPEFGPAPDQSFDQSFDPGFDPGADFVELPPEAPTQVMVDVTLILSDDRRGTGYGVNLLDGLNSQFSLDWRRTSTRTDAGSFNDRQITRAISLRSIDYNLNIFNRSGRYYEVVARPSLTAYLGEESRFFIGETSNVAVSGVNTAGLERIDIGVTLKVTPIEIRSEGALFRIEADRGFFSDQNPGSFAEQLTIFQQQVAATAEVRFGETLVLSGLSEQVADGQSSRTPVLGDIPGVDAVFSRRTHLDRRRTAIVLVTPSAPAAFATAQDRDQALVELDALWADVLEPRTGLDRTAARARALPLFTRGRTSDAPAPDLKASGALDAVVVAAVEGRAL